MDVPSKKPASMGITSPATGGTVGTSFTATGSCSSVVSSTDHPTMTATFTIGDTPYTGTMSYPGAGSWSADFSNIPTGSGGTLKVTCSAMSGDDPESTGITVTSGGGAA